MRTPIFETEPYRPPLTHLEVQQHAEHREEHEDVRLHEEQLLDEALAATFPASDPISSLSVG